MKFSDNHSSVPYAEVYDAHISLADGQAGLAASFAGILSYAQVSSDQNIYVNKKRFDDRKHFVSLGLQQRNVGFMANYDKLTIHAGMSTISCELAYEHGKDYNFRTIYLLDNGGVQYKERFWQTSRFGETDFGRQGTKDATPMQCIDFLGGVQDFIFRTEIILV